MTNTLIQNLERMLANGKDNALLRFSLGNEYLKLNDVALAVMHLELAVALDPHYSAAWKSLGKALESSDNLQAALDVYREGIEVANNKGDKQAAKEMAVFAGRIEKRLVADE